MMRGVYLRALLGGSRCEEGDLPTNLEKVDMAVEVGVEPGRRGKVEMVVAWSCAESS